MDRYLVLASFNERVGDISYEFSTELDLLHEPGGVTLGFRQVFRKCFKSVRYREFKGASLNWMQRKWALEALFYFESTDTPFSETDADIYTLGFILSTKQEPSLPFSEIRLAAGLDEQGAIYTLVDVLPSEIQRKLTGHLRHSDSFPGLSSIELPEKYAEHAKRAIVLYGFYYIAKLLLWRIRREQADINISLLQSNFKDAIFRTAIQRSRIINIKRYQLTSNTTNTPVVKEIIAMIKTHLNLEREYQNDEELNTLIEEYLASLERLFMEENRRRIELGVAVFSFIAVPFTVFAALLAMVALPETVQVFQFTLHQSTNYGIWFLLGLSTAIPAMIYAAISIRGRNETVSKRLSRFRDSAAANRSSRSRDRLRARRSGTRSS
ncbi:MAG: hypothetical protein ACJ8ER_13710 [Allosphingosinicella sp.]